MERKLPPLLPPPLIIGMVIALAIPVAAFFMLYSANKSKLEEKTTTYEELEKEYQSQLDMIQIRDEEMEKKLKFERAREEIRRMYFNNVEEADAAFQRYFIDPTSERAWSQNHDFRINMIGESESWRRESRLQNQLFQEEYYRTLVIAGPHQALYDFFRYLDGFIQRKYRCDGFPDECDFETDETDIMVCPKCQRPVRMHKIPRFYYIEFMQILPDRTPSFGNVQRMHRMKIRLVFPCLEIVD